MSAAGVLAAAALVLISACGPSEGTPRAAAERFLDGHYVMVDLPSVRELVTGLARDKIDEEISLTAGLTPEANCKPRVNYRMRFAEEDGEHARYEYELRVSASGMDPFSKLVILSLRSGEHGWQVSNFSESDPQ